VVTASRVHPIVGHHAAIGPGRTCGTWEGSHGEIGSVG
jgi:hypothetical protein